MKYAVAVCVIIGFVFGMQSVVTESISLPHDNSGWGIVKDNPLKGFR